MALAVNILTLVVIPPVILFGFLLTEAFSLSITLLLNVISSVLHSSFNLELLEVMPLSSTNTFGAFTSCCSLVDIGIDSLGGDKEGLNSLFGFTYMTFIRLVVSMWVTAPVIYSAITVSVLFSILVLIVINFMERAQLVTSMLVLYFISLCVLKQWCSVKLWLL